jgi:hypothetical protein
MEFPAFEVIPYSANAFCAIVERVTKSPFHRIKQKRQISYINNYLMHWPDPLPTGPHKLTMVVENYYIDNHYIEDFSQYFVRCFNSYPRDCCRIHFLLNSSISYSSLKQALHTHQDQIECASLNEKYLGYLVIRPLPETFLAKVCLRPYLQFAKEIEPNLILAKEYNASLFGIPLNVKTIAFQEQDGVLSACATSALWSLLHAHPCVSFNNLPSSISITKSAYSESQGSGSIFPNKGLSIEMICRSLQANHLESQVIDVQNKSKLLLEEIYAYCSGGLPLILGVNVKGSTPINAKKSPSYKEQENTSHAVTILGFRVDEKPVTGILNGHDSFRTKADRISRIFAHDDRTGPFTRILLTSKLQWTVQIDRNVSLNRFPQEIYIPTNLVIGVYHKIRIHYPRIRESCRTLIERLVQVLDYWTREYQKENNKSIVAKLKEMRSMLSDLEWDIKLQDVSKLKKRVFEDSSISDGRERVLTKNLPRFIWSAKASFNDKDFFELLFDATDIPQGTAFLDIIHYGNSSQEIFSVFERFCKKNIQAFQNDVRFENIPPDNIWGIVSYFAKKPSISYLLDNLFGELKSPHSIKEHETLDDAVYDQKPVRITSKKDVPSLSRSKRYIWVIDEDGCLVIGSEDAVEGGGYNGHPTLLSGGPGRIAGELKYKAGRRWVINSRSGRYSYRYSSQESVIFLQNALRERFRLYFGQKYSISIEKAAST